MPNPYPGRFIEMLAELRRPTVPVVLDLGAGGRQHPDIISMEWVSHPNNSLQGDCLALPFRDSCADLILSQAVLEHVTDPQKAVDEMYRVLRPGGILYVEVAFMQPVHMNPHHYFNITPNGLRWLLRDWELQAEGTLGTAWEVLDWIRRAYGLPRTGEGTHGAVPPDRYWWAASGVYARARRPV